MAHGQQCLKLDIAADMLTLSTVTVPRNVIRGEKGIRDVSRETQAGAAPATVSGEPTFDHATGESREGGTEAETRESGDLPRRKLDFGRGAPKAVGGTAFVRPRLPSFPSSIMRLITREWPMTDMPLRNDNARRAGSILLLTGAATAFSFVFACATPFAALATVAALTMERRDAVVTILLAFAVNQAVGFGFLDYPQDASTIAWGAGIGVAALASLFAAAHGGRLAARGGLVATWIGAFATAFLAWQLALYAAGLMIGTGMGGFRAEIVFWVFQLNAVALVALIAVHYLGRRAGLVPSVNRAAG